MSVVVREPDKTAAIRAVERACEGLNAIVRAVRRIDAKVLDLYCVAEGSLRLL
jgi:hypothetical protein